MAVDKATSFGDFSNFDFSTPMRSNFVTQDVINIEGAERPIKAKSKVQSKASLTPIKKAARVNIAKKAVKKTAKVSNPNISRTPGFNTGIETPEEAAIKDQTEVAKDQLEFDKNSQLYLSAAKFGIDVMNANSAYNSLNASTQLNIMESRRLAADSIARGKQRALDARVEGQLAGGDAALALAAQGQNVQGADAQKVIGSLEDIGIYNGLQEETNSIREALGFELEEVSLEHQLDQAEIGRDATILSSALNFGASAASTL